MTQDLGTAVQRISDNENVKGMIYTVGNEQDYHFNVLFKILKRLGYDWASYLSHLSYGMVDLPSGKMKSREGTVVDADDLIFELIGEKMWLKNEAQMDSFTAISGSGPAYFFFFTECLKNIAIEEGFTEDEANKISQQIIIGSGKLVKDSGIDPKELRENVTSPNGTTEAGLKVLADNKTGLLDKLKQAIMEAKNRSIEISDN